MFVKPAEGLRVLDPASKQPLPAEGREVPAVPYWHRRLRDGDVLAVDPPVKAEE